MLIHVENEQEFLMIEDEICKKVEYAVKLVLQKELLEHESEVNIYFVDNEKIRLINKEQRQKDEPTDVLSFPMLDMIEGKYEADELDINKDTGLLMLGDILISVEKAAEQSKKYGHSLLREIIFLLIHGLLHLLGYDHQNELQEKKMFKKQDYVLRKMEIGRGGRRNNG